MTENETKQAKNRAVLVGLNAHCLSAEENADDTSMEELADLLETAGGVCVGTVFQNKDAPDPRTFIGEGKAAEVKELVGAMGADMVVVDNPLSPSQQRVLSEELGVQVLDRAALILDIFAQRARTREGRLQVELAQYQYLLPRLTGMWTHLERQEGAIGTRGPGETQLETDRRHIRRKIQKLRGGAGAGAAGAGHPAHPPGEERGAGGGHRGLYQRGQVHPAQPADRGGHPRQQPAVRHPGHHHPHAGDQRHLHRAAQRHRGLHPQAAPPSGGGL